MDYSFRTVDFNSKWQRFIVVFAITFDVLNRFCNFFSCFVWLPITSTCQVSEEGCNFRSWESLSYTMYFTLDWGPESIDQGGKFHCIQEHPASLRMISGKNFTRDVVLVNYQKTLKEEYYYQLSWSLNNPASSRFRFPLLTPVRSTQEHHSRTAAGNRD